MFRHYKLLHLINTKGKWATPELQKNSKKLLPSNITEEKSKRFVDKVINLAEKNPHLLTFFRKSKNLKFKNLSKKIDTEGAQIIPDVVAYALVLELLTKAIYDHPKILKDCNKIFKKRKAKTNYLNPENLFQKIKLSSLEGPVIEKIIIKSHKTGKVSKNAARRLLIFNILEADLADIIKSHKNNAKVGWILTTHAGDEPSIWSKNKKAICLKPTIPKQWVDLYQTWQMAFITQSHFFPYLITKLLIPQVADYQKKPSEFIYNRVIALYICLNYVFFDSAERAKNNTPNIKWNDDELCRFWGKCNLEAAIKYKKALAIIK